MKSRIRYNYGICTNRDINGEGKPCPMCANKERQQIINGRDFICSECGERLTKVAPPISFMDKYGKIVFGCILVLFICGIGVFLWLNPVGPDNGTTSGDSSFDDTIIVEPEDTVSVDTSKCVSEVSTSDKSSVNSKVSDAEKQIESKSDVTNPSRSMVSGSEDSKSLTLNLGYATYVGPIKNGKPDGVGGRLTFCTRHVIESRDDKEREADAGDYVIGEFSKGHLVHGKWYNSEGQVKGSLMVGMPE